MSDKMYTTKEVKEILADIMEHVLNSQSIIEIIAYIDKVNREVK